MTKPASGIYWAAVVRGPRSSWTWYETIRYLKRDARAAYLEEYSYGPEAAELALQRLRTGEVQIVKVRVEEVE